MAQRVFVKVIGFSDVERHALNTVFRLSEQRETIYSPWVPDAPDAPSLALVDGQSYEAPVEMASRASTGLKLIWVGADAPTDSLASFERPIVWPEVLRAMDGVFAPPEPLDFDLDAMPEPAAAPALDLDLDFDLDMAVVEDKGPDTEPAVEQAPARRALIAAATLEERLYWRARLSLADLTLADEAATGVQALELARATAYAVVMVDFGLEGGGWPLVKALRQLQPEVPNLVVVKAKPATGEGIRAWLNKVPGFFYKPLNPKRLNARLRKV